MTPEELQLTSEIKDIEEKISSEEVFKKSIFDAVSSIKIEQPIINIPEIVIPSKDMSETNAILGKIYKEMQKPPKIVVKLKLV